MTTSNNNYEQALKSYNAAIARNNNRQSDIEKLRNSEISDNKDMIKAGIAFSKMDAPTGFRKDMINGLVPTSEIQMFNIAAKEYMIGYDEKVGVVLQSTRKHLKGTNFVIQTKNEVMLKSQREDPNFHKLSKTDFDAIMKSKPDWSTLDNAYSLAVSGFNDANLNERIKIQNAKVVL